MSDTDSFFNYVKKYFKNTGINLVAHLIGNYRDCSVVRLHFKKKSGGSNKERCFL